LQLLNKAKNKHNSLYDNGQAKEVLTERWNFPLAYEYRQLFDFLVMMQNGGTGVYQ
jgi:hypothetical protein